jgi:hypothetical protein
MMRLVARSLGACGGGDPGGARAARGGSGAGAARSLPYDIAGARRGGSGKLDSAGSAGERPAWPMRRAGGTAAAARAPAAAAVAAEARRKGEGSLRGILKTPEGSRRGGAALPEGSLSRALSREPSVRAGDLARVSPGRALPEGGLARALSRESSVRRGQVAPSPATAPPSAGSGSGIGSGSGSVRAGAAGTRAEFSNDSARRRSTDVAARAAAKGATFRAPAAYGSGWGASPPPRVVDLVLVDAAAPAASPAAPSDGADAGFEAEAAAARGAARRASSGGGAPSVRPPPGAFGGEAGAPPPPGAEHDLWAGRFQRRWRAVRLRARLQAMGHRAVWRMDSPRCGGAAADVNDLLCHELRAPASPPRRSAARACGARGGASPGGLHRDLSLGAMLAEEGEC